MIEEFVAHELVKKCVEKATKLQKKYTNRGDHKFSKPTDVNRKMQMLASGFIAECAMCIYLGMNPLNDLNWSTGRPDGGIDMIAPNGMSIDVKATDNAYSSRLMWPVYKRDKMHEMADFLVLAKVLPTKSSEMGQIVQLCGYVEADKFRRMHWNAQGLRGIRDNTPYMHEKDLDDIATLKQHITI